ncbi:MAG: RNA polymerase sigma factor [Asticcacaulis sp.]
MPQGLVLLQSQTTAAQRSDEVPALARLRLMTSCVGFEKAMNPATPESDEHLLERIASGDMAAVSMLVSRKLPKLLSLGRRMLNDAAEAEDVAQETLVRTWKQAGNWVPGRAQIDTWMHRVALNLCYDRLRKRRNTVSPDDVQLVDDRLSPPAHIEQNETASALRRALAHLPERQRTAITLQYFQEMSNIEAAHVMDISVEALESLLARGRRGLRNLMQGSPALDFQDAITNPLTNVVRLNPSKSGK